MGITGVIVETVARPDIFYVIANSITHIWKIRETCVDLLRYKLLVENNECCSVSTRCCKTMIDVSGLCSKMHYTEEHLPNAS